MPAGPSAAGVAVYPRVVESVGGYERWVVGVGTVVVVVHVSGWDQWLIFRDLCYSLYENLPARTESPKYCHSPPDGIRCRNETCGSDRIIPNELASINNDAKACLASQVFSDETMSVRPFCPKPRSQVMFVTNDSFRKARFSTFGFLATCHPFRN